MIEINRNSLYTYRLDPADERVIQRRENRHRAHWQAFRLLPSAEEAKRALLRLERKRSTDGADAP